MRSCWAGSFIPEAMLPCPIMLARRRPFCRARLARESRSGPDCQISMALKPMAATRAANSGIGTGSGSIIGKHTDCWIDMVYLLITRNRYRWLFQSGNADRAQLESAHPPLFAAFLEV